MVCAFHENGGRAIDDTCKGKPGAIVELQCVDERIPSLLIHRIETYKHKLLVINGLRTNISP